MENIESVFGRETVGSNVLFVGVILGWAAKALDCVIEMPMVFFQQLIEVLSQVLWSNACEEEEDEVDGKRFVGHQLEVEYFYFRNVSVRV